MSRRRKTRRSASSKKLTAKQKRMQRAVLRVLLVIFALGSSVGAIVYILHLPQLRLEGYEIAGESLSEQEEKWYTRSIELYYDRPRWIIPQDSILRNHSRSLEHYLYARFPALRNVSISREGVDILDIKLYERTLSYHYRMGDGALYRVDERGYIYEQETSNEEPTRVYSHEDSADSLSVRDSVLSGDYGRTNALFDSLDTLGIRVERIVLVNEIELILHLNNGAVLVIDPTVDFQVVIETLREILPYKEFDYNFSEGMFVQPIDYVNLRYGNRILYCYRGDACAGFYQ